MSDGEDFKHWVEGVRRVSGAGGGAGGAWDCGDGDCWVAGCVGEKRQRNVFLLRFMLSDATFLIKGLLFICLRRSGKSIARCLIWRWRLGF